MKKQTLLLHQWYLLSSKNEVKKCLKILFLSAGMILAFGSSSLFSQSCVNLAIPNNACPTSLEHTFSVNGENNSLGNNVDIEKVDIIISHSWRSELDIYLQAPDGTEIELSTDNGGLYDDYGDPNNCPDDVCSFTPWATTALPSGYGDYIGTFKPEGNFSDFSGINPNGDWKLRVCDQGPYNISGNLIYFNLNFVNCLRPIELSVSNETTNGAILDWSELSSATQYDLEIQPIGVAPTGLPTISNVSKPYTWTGGSTATGYTYWVRSQCPSGGFSEWSEAKTFYTAVDNPPAACFNSDIPNDGCIPGLPIIVTGVTGSSLGTDVFLDGVKVVIDHPSVREIDMYLIAPDGTEVELSTDNGSSGDNYGNPANCPNEFSRFAPWASTSIDAGIAPFIGNFKPEGNLADFDGQNPNGIWKLRICDDFGFFYTGTLNYVELEFTDCIRPGNLSSDNYTTSGAELSWTELGNATSWDIEIQPIGTPFTGTATHSNVSNPFTWSNGNPSSAYHYKVRSHCTGGGTTVWSNASQFHTATNHPLANCFNVDIPDNDCATIPLLISGVSGTNLGADIFLDGIKVIIEHPVTYDLGLYLEAPNGTEVLLSLTNGGAVGNYGDPNNCPNEFTRFATWSAFSINDASPPFIGDFQPSGNLTDFDGQNPNGTWLLRVCDNWIGNTGSLKYIELEFSDCSRPHSLSSSNPSNFGADLDWIDPGTGITWDIEIQPEGSAFTGSPTVSNVSKPYTWTGGTAAMTYFYKVRSNCSGSTTGWSTTGILNTTDACFNSSMSRIYVDVDATGDQSGSSWSNARTSLQSAIHLAALCSNVTEIWVAEGTYYPTRDKSGNGIPIDQRTKTFFMETNVKIYGGFNGTETSLGQRDWVAHSTILSGDIGSLNNTGDNSYHVVWMEDQTGDMRLDGFTITKGNANASSLNSMGGGIFNQTNTSSSFPTIANCLIAENYADYGGGLADYSYGSNFYVGTTLINCLIINNSASRGGGIYAEADGGSAYTPGSVPKVYSCTFFGNTGNGKSVYLEAISGGGTTVKVFNSISWGPSSSNHFQKNLWAAYDFDNCIIQGGCPNNGNCTNVINQDPLYVNAGAGDFQVQDCSPAIDAGTSTNAPSTDYNDDSRPHGSGYDIGAFEYQSNSNGNLTCYRDQDNDNFGDPNNAQTFCNSCDSGWVTNNTDCNDNDSSIHPNATEVCDGVDNNCNSQTDEGLLNTYYADTDNDTFGDPGNPILACAQPSGYVSDNTDCDDNDSNEYPGQTWHKDADGDGFGDGTSIMACTRPANHFLASELTQISGDCNDNDVNIHPNATEICDGIDNNCDNQTDEGLTFQDYYLDNDSDGFGAGNAVNACQSPGANYVTQNGDCNDNDASIHPNATEICDGIDNNCDNQTDEGLTFLDYYLDNDSDGFGAGNAINACQSPGANYVTQNGDCNDNDASIHPNATEICDGIDNNCNSQTDEGLLNTYYADTDNDNYGDAGNSTIACTAPNGFVADNTDCNDNDGNEFPGQTWYKDADGDDYGDGTSQTACTRPANHFTAAELTQTSGDCNDNDASIHPGAVELCDGIDNDCNNQIDDGIVFQDYYLDNDSDGFGTGNAVNACQSPGANYVTQNGDCNDNDSSIHPNATEVCDGIDNNCNSQTDEGVLTTFYEDSDNDGFGNLNSSTQACAVPNGYVTDNTDCNDNDANEFPGQTWYNDTDGDGYSDGNSQTTCIRPANHYTAAELIQTSGDCNDNDANIHPGATEICDGIDNNCNSQTDEGVMTTFYADTDNDGFGDAGTSTQTCSAPSGYVTDNTDCNDNDANEFPGQIWYKDADGDGYSDGTSQNACARPADHFLATELTQTAGDCNDTDAAIHPNATEVCDGIDNNCNAQTDEGVQSTFYADSDNDGFGDIGNATQACAAPSGYVADNTDCNDNDGNEYPGQIWHKDLDGDGYGDGTSQASCSRPANHYLATELTQTSGDCNDNDANEFPGQNWYQDADGDGFSEGTTQTTCARPLNFFLANELTATSGDCNDGNASIHPGATEICDGIDNNCNAQTDEGVLTTYYADTDGDNYGDAGTSTQACSVPSGYVTDNTDCNDNNSDEHPGQTWHKDADGDGYGDGTSQNACARPADHFLASELTQTTGDCNDNDAAINPDETEVCGDGIDNNCDGQIDEGCCAAPEAICQNFTAFLDNSGNVTITEADVDAGSTADCGLQSLVIDQNSFDCSHVGIPQNVVLTITDIYNASDNCTATVTVEDDKKPSISCPGNFSQNVDPGTCSTTVSLPTATANDNCGTPTLDLRWREVDPITNANLGPWSSWTTNTTHTYDSGKYKFQWRAKDAAGNNKKCARYVEVIDNEAPQALCQNVTASLDPNTNQVTITPQEVDNGSTDNCGITNLQLDQTVFDCNNSGINAVTLTVEDANGNTHQCTADVIIDGTMIEINDISQNEGNGTGFTFYFFKIERTGPDCATNVDYATSDGTATISDNDYVSGTGTAYFPQGGSNTRYVICRATKDNTFESDEMFYVDLSNATNGGQIIDNQGEAEVVNDDSAPLIGNSDNDPINFESSDLNSSKITLYPNPAVDILHIEFAKDLQPNENTTVELYDVLERRLGSFDLSKGDFSIDVSALLAGSYYLLFQSGNETIVKRFTKVD